MSLGNVVTHAQNGKQPQTHIVIQVVILPRLIPKFRGLLKMGSRTLTCTTCWVSLKHKIPGFPSAISQLGKEVPPTTYQQSSALQLLNGKQIETQTLSLSKPS